MPHPGVVPLVDDDGHPGEVPWLRLASLLQPLLLLVREGRVEDPRGGGAAAEAEASAEDAQRVEESGGRRVRACRAVRLQRLLLLHPRQGPARGRWGAPHVDQHGRAVVGARQEDASAGSGGARVEDLERADAGGVHAEDADDASASAALLRVREAHLSVGAAGEEAGLRVRGGEEAQGVDGAGVALRFVFVFF